MKKTILSILALVLATPMFAQAPVQEHLQNHFKFYGFIRNYSIYDSRESKSGTSDLFYYLPLDHKMNEDGTLDLNDHGSFRFVALTSRVGLDVSGYQINNVHFGAKVEADFYAGLSSFDSKDKYKAEAAYYPGNTNITGTANKAHNDASGADIVNTYVHKTSVNEEISGVKTFNDVLKGSNIEPKVHTGSSVGSSTVPYENVYATNITSTNASIDNITGTLTGNASTATKLATTRKINGTDFDGTTAITTSSWGSARNVSIGDASSTNTGAAVSVNGSSNITLKLPSTIKATLTGNASTATKLAVSKKINNTSFDGSSDITTAKWGTSREIKIYDCAWEYQGSAVSVDGSSDINLRLPANIIADNFYGVASSATKLKNAVTINGTSFDGSANITTAAWGYSRNMQITDSDLSNSGAITSVNGTNNITLKLPSTIKATLRGNADTATKASCLDNYNAPGGNKIYLDWNIQKKGYVGLKVDKTTMGGLITTDNIGMLNVVHKTGNETIDGTKTFKSLIIDNDTFTHISSYSGVHWVHTLPPFDGELLSTRYVRINTVWYRIHSDGFIETGGFTDCADKRGFAVATNLPIPFSYPNYTLIVQFTRGTAGGDRWGDDYMCSFTQTKTTTGFVVYSNHLSETGRNGGGYDWYACGY